MAAEDRVSAATVATFIAAAGVAGASTAAAAGVSTVVAVTAEDRTAAVAGGADENRSKVNSTFAVRR